MSKHYPAITFVTFDIRYENISKFKLKKII